MGVAVFRGSLRFAIGVVGFIQDRLVHSGSPLGKLVSFGVFGFTRVRSGGRCVHPRTLGSLAFALGVVGFIRGRRVHSGSPSCGSFSSSRVVGLTRIRPVGDWVHPASLGSLAFAVGVVGFFRCRWVHSGWSSGVVGFTRLRPGGGYVNQGSLDSLKFALVDAHLGSIGSLNFALGVTGFMRVHSGSPWGRWVHQESLGSLRSPLGSLGSQAFAPGSLGALSFALRGFGLFGVVRFTRDRPWCRWVHAGLLGSLRYALAVVVFIRGRWVHSCFHCGSLGSSSVVGFTRVRPWGRLVHLGRRIL